MIKQLQDKIKFIKEAVKDGKYRYTIHGAKQRIARRLRRREIEVVDIITVYELDQYE